MVNYFLDNFFNVTESSGIHSYLCMFPQRHMVGDGCHKFYVVFSTNSKHCHICPWENKLLGRYTNFTGCLPLAFVGGDSKC